jgi:DNA-binding transcriptional LysR family regulator
MDLKILELFCRIVELGSFSRAAEAVALTQPTVSGHIKTLEDEIGLRLFERTSRRVRPTQAGEILYGYALRMLALRAEARQAIGEHRGGLSGHLTVGGSSIPGAYILPALAARFKAAHPGIRLTLEVRDSREIVRAVAEGACEAGLVGARFPESRARYESFGHDELVLAVPASHAWAARRTVRVGELAGQPVILRERGSGTRKVTEEALAAHGLTAEAMPVALEAGSNEAVRQAVKAGAGVAVISQRAIEDDIRGRLVVAVRLQGLRLRRELFLVTHRRRAPSPAGAAFLAFLRSQREE